MTGSDRVMLAVNMVQSLVPGYEVTEKSGSSLQRAIGRIMGLLGNREYMTSYWTTFGTTSYRPSGHRPDDWQVVLHEGLHARRNRDDGSVGRGILYMLPQALAPVVLLGAFVSPWFLLGLLLLLPLPAYFRMRQELEAYTVSMACQVWAEDAGPTVVDGYVDRFYDGSYYRMWPFRSDVRRRLWDRYLWIVGGGALEDTYMQGVRRFCTYIKNGAI